MVCSPRLRVTPRPVEVTVLREECAASLTVSIAASPARCTFSPPPAREARGGEGAGVGGGSAHSVTERERESAGPTPTPPHPPPPLRGGRGADRARGEAALNSSSVGRNPASVLPAPVGAIK